MQRARKIAGTSDHGFTLIELLVVIVIIGVLSAIAVPVFLNQREKAYDGAAKSDMRNLAQFEEAYLVGNSSYGSIATLIGDGNEVRASRGVTVRVVQFDGAIGYCLSARHIGSTSTWFFDSQAGGQQPAGSSGCPVTTTGTAGDSLTG